MIKIISFVDSFKHFEEPIKEFLKRLGKNIEFKKLKPSKKNEIKDIIIDESVQLKKVLENEKGYKILLYIKGVEMSTLGFQKFIEEKNMNHGDIIFIIGGAYGVDFDIIKENIDYKISLSNMTFTHIGAVMLLLEQLYRISCIKKGIKYHH